MSHQAWLTALPDNAEHWAYFSVYAILFFVLAYQAHLSWCHWNAELADGREAITFRAAVDVEIGSNVLGSVTCAFLVAHEAVWAFEGRNLPWLVRVGLVFIGFQMTMMFAISTTWEELNHGAHVENVPFIQTRRDWWRLTSHRAWARMCRQFTGFMTGVSLILTLCLAATIPIITHSSPDRFPRAFVAYVWFAWALMVAGILVALYLPTRRNHELGYDADWRWCWKSLLPLYIACYILIGLALYYEVSADALDAQGGEESTHMAALFEALYFVLVCANSHFMRRHQLPPLPPEEEPAVEQKALVQ